MEKEGMTPVRTEAAKRGKAAPAGWRKGGLALAAVAALMLAGSAAWAGNSSTSAGRGTDGAKDDPPPRVQDCAIVTLSTPVLYACRGKTYTEYELSYLRQQYEQRHQSARQ